MSCPFSAQIKKKNFLLEYSDLMILYLEKTKYFIKSVIHDGTASHICVSMCPFSRQHSRY